MMAFNTSLPHDTLRLSLLRVFSRLSSGDDRRAGSTASLEVVRGRWTRCGFVLVLATGPSRAERVRAEGGI